MKISPINNYQINKNQKMQTKSKSNPNFEGVKLVMEKPSAEWLAREFKSPEEVRKFKIAFDKKLNEVNNTINKKFLPERVKAMLNDRSEKTYEDAIERIWPKDTEYKLHYKCYDCIHADILINDNRGNDIPLNSANMRGTMLEDLDMLNAYIKDPGADCYNNFCGGYITRFLVKELKQQPNFESYMEKAESEMRILQRTEEFRQKIREIEMDYIWYGDAKKGKKEALEAYTNTLIEKINNNEISIADAKDELTILSKETKNSSANVISRIEKVIKNKEVEIEKLVEAKIKYGEVTDKVSNLIDKIYDGVPFSNIEEDLTKLSKKYNDDVLDVDTIFEENLEFKLDEHKKYFNIRTGAKFDSSYKLLMEKLKRIYSKEKFENLEKDIEDLAPLLDDKYIISGDLKTNNILLKYPNAKKQVIMRCIKDANSNNISHSIESDGNIYKFAKSKNLMINSENTSNNSFWKNLFIILFEC